MGFNKKGIKYVRNRPLSDVLTGKVFGKWTVGEPLPKETRKEKGGVLYSCTCTCGAVKEVRAALLVNGGSTQCQECYWNVPICKKGHDTTICGRTKSRCCRMCAKENALMYNYGITLAEYEALYNLQERKCAICGKELAFTKIPGRTNEKGRTEVDHEHIAKKQKDKPSKKSTVRGLLCGGRFAGCNRRLGKIDNAEWLKKALAYIENPPAKQLFKKEKM